MERTIDLRITFDNELIFTSEDVVVHNVLAELDDATSVVVLRNDGFANILPDEATRQDK